MKKLIALISLLGFVAVLGPSSAAASDYVTFCIKQKKNGDAKKNTKPNRAAKGTEPGSACKNKQVEVTVPTDQITDGLQSQISDNDNDIADNASDIEDLQEKTTLNMDDIADNDIAIEALEVKTTQNMDDIAANTAAIESNDSDISDLTDKTEQNMDDIDAVNERVDAIATVIGGGTGMDELSTTDDTQFMGMFFSRTAMSDLAVENRIPIAGTLTNFWARQTGETTGDAQRLYTVLLRAAPAGAVATALNCIIAAGERVCADDSNCVDVVANRRISVEVDSSDGTGTLEAGRAQWSAKFTPGAVCPIEP